MGRWEPEDVCEMLLFLFSATGGLTGGSNPAPVEDLNTYSEMCHISPYITCMYMIRSFAVQGFKDSTHVSCSLKGICFAVVVLIIITTNLTHFLTLIQNGLRDLNL